jgi:hypothetical protein
MNAEEENLLHELDLALENLATEVSREDVQHLLEAAGCDALNKIDEVVLPDFSQPVERENIVIARWALTAHASNLHYNFASHCIQRERASQMPMLGKIGASLQELALAA